MRHKASGEKGWGQFADIERAQASTQKRQQQEATKKNSEGIEEEEEKKKKKRDNKQLPVLRCPRIIDAMSPSQQPAMLTLIGGSRHGNNRSGA